jgi:hypothetical protein
MQQTARLERCMPAAMVLAALVTMMLIFYGRW